MVSGWVGMVRVRVLSLDCLNGSFWVVPNTDTDFTLLFNVSVSGFQAKALSVICTYCTLPLRVMAPHGCGIMSPAVVP